MTASLRRLGHPAAFVSAVGDDVLGRRAVDVSVELGIDPAFITVSSDLPTGTVTVLPDAIAGHRFEIRSPAAYEVLDPAGGAADDMTRWGARAFVFGTLAQRFTGTLELTRRIAAGGATERLYDVNLRDGTWGPALIRDLLAFATIVKVNEDEAATVASFLGCDPDPTALGDRLAAEYGIGTLCVTRGAAGAVLRVDGQTVAAEGIPVTVVDTVGAGDAFAAGLLHGTLVRMPPSDRLAFANRLGALVASRPGALPPWTADEVAEMT